MAHEDRCFSLEVRGPLGVLGQGLAIGDSTGPTGRESIFARWAKLAAKLRAAVARVFGQLVKMRLLESVRAVGGVWLEPLHCCDCRVASLTREEMECLRDFHAMAGLPAAG